MRKYNVNYIKIFGKKRQESLINNDSPKMSDEFPGKEKETFIKIELKCPLILMRALDQNGIITTETVNVDYRVEKLLSSIIIHNTIDLTRQIVKILKDNNFCRKIYVSKRALTKKYKTKRMRSLNKKNDLPSKNLKIHSPRLSLGIIPDVIED